MPVNIRPFPVLKGKDAEIFLNRQREHRKKLEMRLQRKLEELYKKKHT